MVINYLILISYKQQQQQQQSILNEYDIYLINKFIEFEIDTKKKVINTMNKVKNKNDINRIVECMTSTNNDYDNKNDNKSNKEKDKNISYSIQKLTSMRYDVNSVKIAVQISDNNIEIAANLSLKEY